jgi:CTP synthase (UTP-ammonia lyase)
LGITDADHAEYCNPSLHYVIVPVTCAVPHRPEGAPKLSGACPVRILPGTRLYAAYGREDVSEEFFCNYEVNPEYREALQQSDLRVSAVGEAGEVRAVELPAHRFFVATLFQPQLGPQPHPVIAAYLDAIATS